MSVHKSAAICTSNMKFNSQYRLIVSYVYTKIQMNTIKCVKDIQVPTLKSIHVLNCRVFLLTNPNKIISAPTSS